MATSFYQILFAVARAIGKTTNAYVTTGGTTTAIATGLQETTDSTFVGAIAHVMGNSTTYATVTAYNGTNKQLTFSTSLATSIGSRLQLAMYDADMFAGVFDACNEMIRSSWGQYYTETVVDRNSAGITLAANTHSYALPAAVSQLVQIGIQATPTADIVWFDPLDIWRVEGQEGALTLRFLSGYGGGGEGEWSSRVHLDGYSSYGSFADVWTTQPLCLRYYGREPEMTSETGTTSLPLDYASWVTAESYVQTYLANASQNTARVMNVFLPQIQQKALQAKARLRLTKPSRMQTVTLDY